MSIFPTELPLVAGWDRFETITEQPCWLIGVRQGSKILIRLEAPLPTVGLYELIGRNDGMKGRWQIALRDSFRQALTLDERDQFADALSRSVFHDNASRSFPHCAGRPGELQSPLLYALLCGECLPLC